MLKYVEKHQQRIIDAFHYIWKNPETGYREWKTHRYLKEQFEELGYTVNEAGNIPGFYVDIDTGRPGPTLAIFGEMDGLIIPEHPECDKETGAVHACGHVLQVAALVGIAGALKEDGALDGLSGKIRLIAVPAEEGIELAFRLQLRNDGIIGYRSGKIEFVRRGYLDGVDLAFMVHAHVAPLHHGYLNGGSNGLIAKTVTFEGVAAHAGGLPHQGINALYAATTALQAINALRETFEDQNHIRVHPIITEGGSSVNVIPNKVKLESYVRGANMPAVAEANKKIDRAIAAAAASIGAKVHITDTPGSWPRLTDRVMMQVFEDAMDEVLETKDCSADYWNAGCSDMGDIGSMMPTVHAYVGGATGKEHGNNYRIPDPVACVDSAKLQVEALKRLLENDAAKAKEAVANYKPFFTCKEDYFAYIDALNRDYDAVIYSENGDVTLAVGR